MDSNNSPYIKAINKEAVHRICSGQVGQGQIICLFKQNSTHDKGIQICFGPNILIRGKFLGPPLTFSQMLIRLHIFLTNLGYKSNAMNNMLA